MQSRLLQLVALCAFAFAQPLFDLLGRYPEFFPANGVSATGVLVFAVCLVLAPPLVLWLGLEWPFCLLRRGVGGVHAGLVAVLVALIALPGLASILPPGFVWQATLAGALGLGAAFAFAFSRVAALSRVVTLLSLCALLFPVLFLSTPALRGLFLANPVPAATPDTEVRDTPVVLLVFDELPISALLSSEGQVDRARFPNFAALASDATLYRDATTVADGTVHAVPAIFSGERIVDASRVPTDGAFPVNLFTLLVESHDMLVHESASRLCPPGLCRALPAQGASSLGFALDVAILYGHVLLPETLSTRLPDISQAWGGFAGEHAPAKGASEAEGAEGKPFGGDWLKFVGASLQIDRVDLFRRFVRELRERDRPALRVLHILLPHPPLRFLPQGQTYKAATQGLRKERWSGDPYAALQGWQRFLLQLQWVDVLLGEFLAELHRSGLYDRSLIVVTGDHGSNYRENDERRALSETNAGDVLAVPIFLKLPGQSAPAVSDEPVETIDILPTLLELLNVTAPQELDGFSLLRGPESTRRRRAISYADRALHEVGDPSRAVRESIARKERNFGPSEPGAHFFAVGPHRLLLGTQREATAELRPIDAKLEVRSPSQWVEGELEGGTLGAPADLVLVVDGVVRAVTRTYEDTSPPRFSAILRAPYATSEIEVFSVGPLKR